MKIYALLTFATVSFSSFAAEKLQIDPSDSKITFVINNKPPNAAESKPVPGSFKDFSGTILFDETNPAASSVEIEIKTTSVDTANEKRDDHLRNQDFFKVKEFPVMTFKSKSVKKLEGDQFEVTGDITLLGVTKENVVVFEKTGERTGKSNFQIKRSDYGMTYRLPDTADEVNVTLDIVAKAK